MSEHNDVPPIQGGQGRSDSDMETQAEMQLAAFCFVTLFLLAGVAVYFSCQ